MILWFLTIAGLGLKEIIKNPEIFLALNPYYGLNFFFRNGISSFLGSWWMLSFLLQALRRCMLM